MGSMRYIQTIEQEFMTYQLPRKRRLRPISRSPRNIIKLKMESDGVDSGIPMSIFGKTPSESRNSGIGSTTI